MVRKKLLKVSFTEYRIQLTFGKHKQVRDSPSNAWENCLFAVFATVSILSILQNTHNTLYQFIFNPLLVTMIINDNNDVICIIIIFQPKQNYSSLSWFSNTIYVKQ